MRLNLVLKLWRLARKHKRASRFYLSQLTALQTRHESLLRQVKPAAVVVPKASTTAKPLTDTAQAVLDSYRDQARDAGLDETMAHQWFEEWRKLEQV